MATFSAMTWNVENLFRPDTEAEGTERERYQSKLGLLAEVIGRLAPDAVALEEVGGEGPVEDLQDALKGAIHIVPCPRSPTGAASGSPSCPGTRSRSERI